MKKTSAADALRAMLAQRDLFEPAIPNRAPVPYSVACPGAETYFASGSNHAGEIAGLRVSGINPGVSANHVNAAAEAELIDIGETGVYRVFVDSGAFGEVRFGPNGPSIRKLITEKEWRKRLALYARLATTLGPRLYCVAPDMVGYQTTTLQRIERYAPELKALIAKGVNIIVPVQKGELSMPEFAIRVVDILGTFDLVWGIPSKKDATSLSDIVAFADWLSYSQLPEVYRPGVSLSEDNVDSGCGWQEAGSSRLHLLGMGPSSPRFRETYAAIRKASPLTTIFSDSVRITALVGHGTVRKDGSRQARPLTAARAKVIAEGKLTTVVDVKRAALASVMHEETREEAREARRRGWFDPELESAPGVPLEPGCIDYGTGGAL